jgi:hypothetical protein
VSGVVTASDTDSKTMTSQILPSYQYDGNNPIEEQIYKTEIERNPVKKTGCFLIVSPKIMEISQEGDLCKVFLISNGKSYLLGSDNTITTDTSWSFPVAVTYKKDKNENCILQKYEIPQEGSYEESIREFCKTPITGKEISGLANKMMDMDFSELDKNLNNNLHKYFSQNNLKNITIKE